MRNYFDDDEELELYAPLLTDMPQPQGPAPAQPMQRDPELDAAWSDRQRAALEASYPNQSYGVGEFARDNGAALLAMALDAGFNKGRGLANIVAGTAQEVGAQKAYRDKQAQAQADIAIRMRGRNVDPYAQQLAAQRLAVSQQNAGTNAQRVNQTQQRFADQGNPESDYSRGRVTQQERLAGAGATGRLNAEHELNPQTAADKADIRTAETEAQIAAQHGAAPQIAADEAAKAGAVAQARLPSEQALKTTPSVSEQRSAAEKDLAATPYVGTSIADEAAWRAHSANPTQRARGEQFAQASNATLEALDRMIASRKAGGRPWEALNDAEKRAALKQMKLDQALAVGGVSTLANTASVNAGEFPRYAESIPNGEMKLSDVADAAFGLVPGMTPRDSVLEQLEATRKGIGSSIGSNLKGMGLAYGAAPAPTAAPQQLPGEAVPANLGVVPGKVPPISAADSLPQKPPGGHLVRLKSGRIVATMMQSFPPGVEVIE